MYLMQGQLSRAFPFTPPVDCFTNAFDQHATAQTELFIWRVLVQNDVVIGYDLRFLFAQI